MDIEQLFTSGVIELSQIDEKNIEIMSKEGEAYFSTPQDLQETIKGFVELWTKGSAERLNETPVQHMYSKLINVYGLDERLAYSLCEHYVKVKVYAIVANV